MYFLPLKQLQKQTQTIFLSPILVICPVLVTSDSSQSPLLESHSFLANNMIINKQLKTIPFGKLYEVYNEASSAAIEGLEQHYELEYQREVERLESEYTSQHEAPSEVGFGDQVTRHQFDKTEAGRKAGQKAIIDVWIPRYKLGSLLVSVLPQIMAHITQKPLRLQEFATAEGKIDAAKILKHIFDFDSDWERGLYLFLMLDSRSSYLPSQYKGEGVQFCSLVPLIMYAFKLHHKVPYSQWCKQSIHWVVNKSLCEAMRYEHTFTREDILAARDLGLVYQNGAKQGETRNAQSNFKLWATKGGCLHGTPHLAQVMLTQIWSAHPSSRTPYMVLDPLNWDHMPPPLITSDIFKTPAPTKPKSESTYPDLPWL